MTFRADEDKKKNEKMNEKVMSTKRIKYFLFLFFNKKKGKTHEKNKRYIHSLSQFLLRLR